MKNDRNKIQEPFNPETTPNPPQIIDPSKKSEEGDAKKAKDQRGEGKPDQPQRTPSSAEKGKLLGEAEPDIHDETTI